MPLPSHLISEWHPSKNTHISIYDIKPDSYKIVWWLCSHGHEWETEVQKRAVRGYGCPYCSGRRAYKDNCLETLNPKLSAEWHPTKNLDLTPQNVRPNSGKKVWWLCSHGHEWYAQIKSRNKGASCPICSGRVAIKQNSFAALYPDILKEWHPVKNGSLSPEKLKPRAANRIWWICAKGHEWEATLHNRVGGTGCPYCSGRRVCYETSLQNRNPDLAKEWHPFKNQELTPKDVALNYNKKVWWKCKRGHEWQASPNGRARGTGCPLCNSVATSRMELRIFSELKHLLGEVLHREKILKKEIDIFIPKYKIGIEVDGLYWHKAKYSADLSKFNKLTANGIILFPVRENGLKPLSSKDVYFTSSNINLNVIKSLISMILTEVTVESDDSDKLNNYLTVKEFINNKLYNELMILLPSPMPGKSLNDSHPEISKEWHQRKNGVLTPLDFYSYSNEKVWWVCAKGHEWEAAICDRTGPDKTGCPYCANKKVCEDNCLAIVNPLLAMEWHPVKNGTLTPKDITAGTSKNVWWLCDAGHEWRAPVERRNKGIGCKKCGAKRANDATRGSIAMMQELAQSRKGECLSIIYKSARDKLTWRCSEGHIWEATPDIIKNQGSWCPICAKQIRTKRI